MSDKAATRAEVYSAIDSERDYQDSLARNVVNKKGNPTFSPMTNLCIIDDLCAQMKAEFYRNPGHPPLDYMRKIAATAVRTMEHFGAPARIKVGDIVRRTDGGFIGGGSNFKTAVVVDANPVALSNVDGNSIWFGTEVEAEYTIIGTADDDQLNRCVSYYQEN